MNKLAFGPFVGEFRYEVFYFLPFVKWVINTIKPDKTYICTHFNREFLYKNFAEKIFHIEPMYSIDEYSQKQAYNKNLYKVDYIKITNDFLSKVDVDYCYNFDYDRSKIPCARDQLFFEPLSYELKEEYRDKIIFIPSRSDIEENVTSIYWWLKDILGDSLFLLGDKKTWLNEENILLKDDYYHHIVYEEMINSISSCRGIICPSSFWTGICNLQGKPVFSWSGLIQEYKKTGSMYFGNEKSMIFPKTNITNIKKGIETFLEERC